jgi:hypothetical protein
MDNARGFKIPFAGGYPIIYKKRRKLDELANGKTMEQIDNEKNG